MKNNIPTLYCDKAFILTVLHFECGMYTTLVPIRYGCKLIWCPICMIFNHN